MPHLFLTGYEKENLEEFLDKLKREGITTVIDVREIPISRKNGFSRPILKSELAKRGIEYYHFPELGSPTKLRRALERNNDYLGFFKSYRQYVNKKRESVAKLIKLVLNNGDNSTLLCFEKESDLCHRSILASEILKMSPKIGITPL
jgi:uncharacterized protein (DUF488 family)